MKLKHVTLGSSTVLIVTIVNRGTGYLRDVMMTAALGASPASQIFVFAFRVFGVVRALTSEAAIPTIVVNRYVRRRLGSDTGDGSAFLESEWGSWWLLAAVWAALLAIANPILVAAMVPPAIQAELSSGFVACFGVVFGIGLSIMSVSAVFPSLFQAQGRFFAHSALASLQNIVFISVFVVVALLRIHDLQLLALQIALSFAIAGLMQIMISCYMTSYPFKSAIWPFHFPLWKRSHLRLAFDSLAKMAPISMFNVTSPIAAVLATLVLVRQDSNITYFFIAERLVQLVPGTVGYAVGIVILPLTARMHLNKSSDLFQTIVLVSALLIVGSGLAVLLRQFSEPIIGLLYQRQQFSEGDTLATSAFLNAIAISVVPLIVEPMLTNRLFGHMRNLENMVLLTGSILICIVVWASSKQLGALIGDGPASEACAVFVFIVTARVVLLMILNIAITEKLWSHFSFRIASYPAVEKNACTIVPREENSAAADGGPKAADDSLGGLR